MPEPLSPEARADFQEHRFQTFRPLALRLGFFNASMPMASTLPQWFLEGSFPSGLLSLRILASLAWLIYPLALLWGAPRRLLPWLLYGPLIAILLLAIWALAGMGPRGADFQWVAIYYFVFPPVLGMPFTKEENRLGILAMLLVPNAAALLLPGVAGLQARFNIMVLPVAAFALFLQGLQGDLLEANHAYRRQVEALAHRDTLTGAYNRRYFLEAAERILQQGRRSGLPTSLLILDIDHFKGVNDRFGHGVGDLVIRETARILGGTLRATDLAARWGGEEFVALLPHADLEAGRLVAERVRGALEAASLSVEGQKAPLAFTASLGLALARAEGEGLAALVDRADRALYEAKRGGRNQTVAAD